MSLAVPIALGAGVVLLLLASRETTPTPPPAPPSPGPAPGPAPDTNLLLAQMSAFILQAQQNPTLVTPDQLAQADALSAQLRAAGRPDAAALLDQWTAMVRARKTTPLPTPGGTPAPGGAAPGSDLATLLQQMTSLDEISKTNPNALDLSLLNSVAAQLAARGLTTQADVLRADASRVLVDRANQRGTAGPPVPGTPVGSICTPGMSRLPQTTVDLMNALLTTRFDVQAADDADALANQIEPCGFSTQVAQLRERARYLRTLR